MINHCHELRPPIRSTPGVGILLSLVCLLGSLACDRSDQSTPRVQVGGEVDETTSPARVARLSFSDVSKASGVEFFHQAGGAPFFVPRSIGSGVALIDVDGDDLLDLYLVQNAGPQSEVTNQLWRQRPDHTFEDVSAGSGTDVVGYGMGCAVGDVNNDGRVDLAVTEYGRLRLFLNQTKDGTIHFVEVSADAGLTNPTWGTSASFFDYDQDGWLDLVVANYLDYDPSRRCTDAGGREDFCGPQSFGPVSARLYHNLGVADGSSPRFEDVTVASGLASVTGAGLGVACADFDGDGRTDIFLANDGMANTLWMNQGDGSFREEASPRGLGYNAVGEAEADMGIALGDVDGDRLFDVFVTHRANETHTLWRQDPRGVYIDNTSLSGITKSAWRGTGFGTVMADLDNDGDLDLALVNGRVLRDPGRLPTMASDVSDFWQPYAQRDQLFVNSGDGQFQDVSEASTEFCGLARVSRGLACGDLNHDGQLDLVVTSVAGPARVLQNTTANPGHWLSVRVIDPKLNRDAIGAQVTVTIGPTVLRREINPGLSFLSSHELRAHFGLGNSAQYDALEVRWPDGVTEAFGSGPADRRLELVRGEGMDSPSAARGELP